MTIPYRPLGLIKEMIDSIGLEVTYVYEDLVFVEHNAFLLLMGTEGSEVGVRFNTESNPEARPELIRRLSKAAAPHSLNITEQGLFSMHQNEEDESFQLEFLE